MFKEFGRSPLGYALIFGIVAMVIANVVIFYAEGEDVIFIPLGVGMIIGALIYFIGVSSLNREEYRKLLYENEKLTNQVQKSQLGEATNNEKQEVSLSFEDNSFENFRGKLSNFEKNVLSHFKLHTGHELSNDLYCADPEKHPEHWLVNLFNKIIIEYQLKYPEQSELQKTLRAADFLIYKVSKHHPEKSKFVTPAIKGLNYLEDKYSGKEVKSISNLLAFYNSMKS